MKIFILLTTMCLVLISGSASAQSSLQQSKHSQPKETPITQGRNAVEFYQHTVESNDALRLSDEFSQYPVDPVERLKPILELGDPFLGKGLIRPGIKSPTGQMLQPWFLLFGSFRSALQSFDNGDKNTSEWANRLDLYGNINLSGTERVLFSMRPLDRETGNYSGYNFSPDNDDRGWREDINGRLTQLFFEGEIGEIFPKLDPTDSGTLDLGFSIGRQPLLIQDGALINDTFDLVGITRNSLVFNGISNLRVTGVYGWNHINKGNNDLTDDPSNDNSAQLFGLFSEADTAWNNTVSLDLIYVEDDDQDAWFVGASSTQRFGMLNSTFRINASIPLQEDTPETSGGVLLLSELSITPHGTDNIAYFNTFWNIDQFTSAARGRDQGNPVANLGILYSPVGMGRYSVPLGQTIDQTVGAALGYQMFLNNSIDSQLTLELGARKSTKSEKAEGALGFGARYQRSIGTHHVLRLDSFVSGREGADISYGFRTEWLIKF